MRTCEGQAVRSRFLLYNTVCTVSLYDGGESMEELLAGAQRIARCVQQMLDLYDPASELACLNREHRPGVPYRVSAELYRYLKRLHALSEQSGGAFDSTIAPLVRLWDFAAERPRVPRPDEIHRALKQVGYRHITYSDADCSVTFQKPGMALDAGASGKGYAVECVADYLRSHGVTSGAINFGGNLYVIGGCRGTGRDWRVGIQRPWASRGQSLGAVFLRDRGAATSGGYDRYFLQDGTVFHHLLDPRTGYPVQSDLLSVTIVSDSAFLTDLLSTTFFVGGEELGKRLVRGAPVPTDYILVKADNSSEASPGLRESFRPQK